MPAAGAGGGDQEGVEVYSQQLPGVSSGAAVEVGEVFVLAYSG